MRLTKKSRALRSDRRKLGPGCLRLFFLPFFLVGVGLLYGLAIRPAWQAVVAQGWARTPCVIESSEVRASSGSDSDTYAIAVTYRYFHDGQNYTSDRYHFSSFVSSSGRDGKQAVVDRLPAGTETYCYVNPEAPHEAVIDRGWQWEWLIAGAFASVFGVVGGLGLFFAGPLARSEGKTVYPRAKSEPSPTDTGGLKPEHTPLSKFIGVLLAAIFWNGITGVFVYLIFFSDDPGPWLAKVFISLFVLIGLFLLGVAFKNFLALFNPRIHLQSATAAVALGGELQFSWRTTGRIGMLQKLRVILQGREEATYRRGTSTSTDTKVFAEIPVFETSERELFAQGNARLVVPPGLMHTFEGTANKVLWRLKVCGEIPRWPDVEDEYPIRVLPLPRGR